MGTKTVSLQSSFMNTFSPKPKSKGVFPGGKQVSPISKPNGAPAHISDRQSKILQNILLVGLVALAALFFAGAVAAITSGALQGSVTLIVIGALLGGPVMLTYSAWLYRYHAKSVKNIVADDSSHVKE